MTDFTPSELDGFVLNVSADMPDSRDYFYMPPPVPLEPVLEPRENLIVLDQASDGACTGFGLAAVINLLNQGRKRDVTISPRMVYEMARKFDGWTGEDYSGSSCRGAIKGFASMGVSRRRSWKYKSEMVSEYKNFSRS